MTHRPIITVPQLFSLLFVSKMIFNLTYTPVVFGSYNMWSNIVSNLIAFVITFILFLPIYKLYKENKNMDIADIAYTTFGHTGTLITIIYALYYMFVVCNTLFSFDILISTVSDPNISLGLLSFCVILVSLYGTYKGIEGLARAGSIILILVAVSLVMIVVSLIPRIESFNYFPIIYSGINNIFKNTSLIVANTSCVPILAMLLPFLSGNIKRGFFVWNTSVFVVTSILVVIIVGSLGSYLNTQMFPFYSVTTVAEIGQVKRMDVMYLGIWTCALFIKITLLLYTSYICIKKIFTKRVSRRIILVLSLIAAAFSIFITKFRFISYYMYRSETFFIFTILTSLVIPVILIIALHIKAGREDKHEN